MYFLKEILHDWPDKYAAKILQALVGALDKNPKSRIIVCDVVQQPPLKDQGMLPLVPTEIRKLQAAMDLTMMSLYNARERSLDDWRKLIKQANERLELKNITSVPGAVHSVLEIGLRE